MLSTKQVGSIKGADGRVNVWEGSIRSGKTISSILRWVFFVRWALTQRGELVMVGRTRDAVWRNVVLPMQDPGVVGGDVAENIVGNFGAPTIKVFGRRIHIMGASDVKAEKVLRGLTVVGAYVDEITTIPEEFWVQLLGRMSPPGSKLFGTTNPDNPAHWLKEKYLDKLPPNWRRFHFQLEDNPSLTRDYVESIKREYSGLWYKRFILGLWVAAEGAIYPSWDPDSQLGYGDVGPEDMDELIAVGIDYGTTNPTRGVLLGRKGETLWAVDEWVPRVGLSDPRLTDSLRAKLIEWGSPPYTVVDPAAASFRVLLLEEGIDTVAGNNKVVPGIRLVDALMATGALKVSPRCKALSKELSGYVWDPKATEKGKDEPLKVNDHSADALRYAIYTTRAHWMRDIPFSWHEITES